MGLPQVDVQITNGNLGQIEANTDGIVGLIVSGTATDEMPLNTGKVIYKLSDLEALEITESTHAGAYRHISEFYAEKEGQECWIMLCNPTTSMTDICDKTNNYAAKLMRDSGNRIRNIYVTRTPGGGYTPTITAGLDADCYTALTKAQELAEYFASAEESSPIRVLIEARSFSGTASALTDLTTMTKNRAGLILMSSTNDGSSSVGLYAGRKANNPVQRKPSRVKDGALPIDECYVGATAVNGYSGITMIHDKGFITARTFAKKTGFYFASDRMATALTDDYSSHARGCVIDKAHIIAYNIYTEELDDDIDIDTAGRIAPGILKSLEAKIESAVNLSMAGEISSFDAYIDPNQNVLSTNKTTVEMNIIPKGYNSNIEVKLGFKNPAVNN